MFRCKVYQFFMRMIPFRAWKSFLLRNHVDHCPDCLEKVAGPEEARSVLQQPEEMGDLEELWPSVEGRMKRREPARSGAGLFPGTGLRWKHAAAAGIFVILILAGILVFREPRRGPEPGESELDERFHINHLKIGDEPANPIIYRPFGSDLILIWAEKQEKYSSK